METTYHINNFEIKENIFKFNTKKWWVDYTVDGVFDSSLRGKFNTKKECVENLDLTIKILKNRG